MYYSVRHTTIFNYSEPISESVTEVRMHPRSEGSQRSIHFDLQINPRANITHYKDYLANVIHHFDIPSRHKKLSIVAQAVVELQPPAALPDQLTPEAWQLIDQQKADLEFFDMLLPSSFTHSTDLLEAFAAELGYEERRDDPLTMLRELNTRMYNAFDYVPNTTRVDSPIDEALQSRQGVCQDYTHIMLALLRNKLQMPCRYISGYLYHHRTNDDTRSAADATHAWVEVWLPSLGWVGFDPTNNLICDDRHIRVAVGRDYADVPPTQGVFKGDAETELEVAVKVTKLDSLPEILVEEPSFPEPEEDAATLTLQQQQQQQQ